MTSEEFITRFHSLEGTTLGEKQKSLRALLNSPNAANLDVSKIQPRNFLEEKFKMDVLIHFKRVPELLEVLKSENPVNIERVFKIDRWFFEAAFANVSVTDLFPSLPFNVKTKLLNKLSVILTDTHQADEIFSNVKDLYGLHLASKILPACTVDLILHVLKKHHIKLPPQQLYVIFKKYPEHRERLLKTIKNNKIERAHNNILQFLKRIDPSTYLELREKYGVDSKLGRRLTAKFIRDNKEAVITDPNTHYKVLHNKQIVKSLQGDLDRLFKNLFPKDIESFCGARQLITSKLNLLPSRINAQQIYCSTFNSVYGTEIWDHPECVTSKLLKMLSPEERQQRIKDEYRASHVTEDEWMCLYNTKISIPFLKKRISLTSDMRTRAELIVFLVDTCKFNENKAALTHVCKYVVSKHRNDHRLVRSKFLSRIADHFLLEKLDEEQWGSITELIQIFQMNQETFEQDSIYLEGYIHYCLLNNLPVKEDLKQWLNKEHWTLNLIKQVPALEKTCLKLFGEIIPEIGKDDTVLYSNYLCALHDFNRRNENDQIPLFFYSKAIEILKKNIIEFKWNRGGYDLLVHFVNNVSSDEKSKYLKLLLCISNAFTDCYMLDNLLKKEPNLILENIEDIASFILKSRYKHKNVFVRRLKWYHHLNLPQTVLNFCTKYEQFFTTDCGRVDKETIENSAFTIFSLLSTKEDYLAYAYNFYPEKPRACSDNNKFRKQKFLCQNIKNIYPVSDVLQPVLNFCKGDYFKLVVGSLYSICGNVNEGKLLPVLHELSNRAVSVQKHCLHLSFRNMTRECIYSAIVKFLEVKKNASVRKFILKVMFNFFSKNPDDYTWNLVKTSVGKLDESDAEAWDLFLQVEKIPTEYLTRYQIFSWDVLHKLPNPRGVLDTKRALVLNSVDQEGSQLLPIDFCQKIISGYLFQSDDVDVLHARVQSFACKYVVYCSNKNEKEERLKSVFALLQYYVKNKWSQQQYRSKARACCSAFLQTFCSEFLQNDSDDKEILQSLFGMWNEMLQPHEAFADYLYLKFTLMYLEKYPIEEFAKQFLEFCDEVTGIYGIVIVELLYNVFKGFVEKCLKRDDDDESSKIRFLFVSHLLTLSNTDAGILMGILLLDDGVSRGYNLKNKLDEVIRNLLDKRSLVVNLFMYRYIRGTTTLEYN